ncbi:MAG: hypothetical protein HUU06_14005, partial [Planctomycetaceae bacterium]|nr:hypothetical protein [Planctomycetaceae bacterium]
HPAHGAPSRPAPSPAPAASPPAEDRRITFAAEDQEIWRVVARIAELAEADVTCDPEHVRGRVTVNFVDVPWRKALESLAHQGGCVVAEGPGGVVQVLSLERSYGVEEPVRRR